MTWVRMQHQWVPG